MAKQSQTCHIVGGDGILVRREVIQVDHGSGLQFGHQHFFDVGREGGAIHRAFDHPRRDHGVGGYLTATLRALLDGHPKSRIDELMPWTFSTASSRAA